MTDRTLRVIEHADDHLEEKYFEVEHETGLRVFVFPKNRQSSCAILACEYGSIDNTFTDNNGTVIKMPDGVAHFLEHKMFEKDDGASVEEIFSRLGAESNAFTKWDATAYYFTCGSDEKFYPCLDELIRFVMTPCFTKDSVEKEKGIISQEIVMCEDDPYDRCFLGLIGGLYSKNPIRLDIAGTVRSIAEINEGLLRACHKKFYTPANMIMITCGNVDVDNVMKSVNAAFADKKYLMSQKPQRVYPQEPSGVNSSRVSISMALERPMFCIGFKDDIAPLNSEERRKREILAEILMGLIFSSGGELYSDLYTRGIMTTPFDFGVEYGKTYAFVYAGGECDDPDIVLNETEKHLKKLMSDGVSKDDFLRRKKMTYSSDIRLYDSTWDIASTLLDDTLAGVELFGESKRISELQPEDANKLLRELFQNSSMTFSVVRPENDIGSQKETEE